MKTSEVLGLLSLNPTYVAKFSSYSTSQLAPLLGLKSLHGSEFCRYGFVFTKVGRNGAESAWQVGKSE